jgi:hypothetical protein
MEFIQDILSLMRKGPELAGQLNDLKLNTKSIARGAKDATFQFPCLVSDTLPIDTASTIARMLDQTYATYTQTWLSLNSMYDVTIDPTPLTYLKKLHQNTRFESVNDLFIDEDDLDDYVEKVYSGDYRCCMSKDGTYGVLFNVADKDVSGLIKENKKLLKEYMSDFDLSPLENITTEAPAMTGGDFARTLLDNQAKLANNKDADYRLKRSKEGRAPRMSDRDLKRANDTVPYGIEVRLMAVNDKKEFIQYVDIIIGVKTILHPVKSEEFTTNIALALQNKNPVFKFLRWTTGEISLVKDLLLNLNTLKMDANAANSAGQSPFFVTLKRLKNRKVGLRNFTVPHALIPNATFVISTYEADYLKNKYGIDLANPRIARKLFDAFLLMTFIVVDDGMGTVSVLYDGDTRFQTYALSTIERDNVLNSNKLSKEIGRMISH